MSLPRPIDEPSESEPDSFVGRVLELRYRVEEKLGEGGLGTVYRAQHLKLARRVAIKVLRDDLRGIPQIRARFEREVKALSSLSHPNVVTITDYGVADGVPFLVMELAEGIELAKMVGAPLPPWRALAIIRQILASLVYAHEREVVHRDLKPANVIVRELPDGHDHVTVLDFGLAKFVGDDAGGADLTRSGLVVGTPAYMPPEQMASGARKADARSDIYAAGLILFELVAGRRPFLFDEPAELLRAHLVIEPPSLAEALGAWVDPRLEQVLTRSLAKVPDERYQSAKAMIDAIDALPDDALVRAGAGAPRRDSTRPARPLSTSTEARASRPKIASRTRSLGMSVGVTMIAFLFAIGGIAWAVQRSEGGASTEAAPPTESSPTVATRTEGPGSQAAAPVVGEVEDDEDTQAEISPQAANAEAEAQAIAAELPGENTEEPPFVAPTQVGPRVAARNPVRGRMPRILTRVNARLQRGNSVGQGDLRLLTYYRNEHPHDVRARILLGHTYMQRGWLSHGIEQYERALALDPSARGNPALLENLLRAVRTETLAARASELVLRVYGEEARSDVQRAIPRTHDDAERARLESLSAMLRPS